MRHLLVSSRDDALAEAVRRLLPADAVLFSARGVDDTLERLARSSRVDAVVTDDREVEAAIREEVPGSLPVVLVPPGVPAREALRRIEEALGGA